MTRFASSLSRLKALRDPFLLAICALSVLDASWLLWVTRHIVALTPDATEYALVARSLVRGTGYAVDMVEFHPGLLPSVHHAPELHGILQSFLIAPFFAACGINGALVRVPSVLFAAAVPLVTFVVTRRAFGEMAGFLAAMLLIVGLDAAVLGVLGTDDVGFACLALLAFHGVERAVETGRRRFVVLAGVAAAFATLMKFTGVVLPFVFAGVILALPRGGAKRKLVVLGAVTGPVLAAAGFYLYRNHLAHGGLGFRVSAIDWLSNESLSAYFVYYDPPPTLLETWSEFGVSRVLELLFVQLKLLGWMVRDNLLLCVGGPVSFIVVRRERALTVFGVLLSLALVGVVALPHHVENRYFFALFPVFAAALAGAVVKVATVARRLRRVVPGEGELRPGESLAVAASMTTLVVGLCLVRGAGALRAVDPAIRDRGCIDAARFLRETARPGATVIASNPWFVSWEADLPAVVAPTNGDRAVITVAKHYGAEWALVGAAVAGSADLGSLLRHPRVKRALKPERAFSGGECVVYRLRKGGAHP